MFSVLFLFILICKFSILLCTNVYINTSIPVSLVTEKYLSIALDSYNGNSQNFFINFTFITPLAKALGPIYFRFGGTDADTTVFQANKTAKILGMTNDSIIFTGNQLDKLMNFTNTVGWRLIFDLNIMLRTSNGVWDTVNAQQFLDYASQHEYNMDFELGNEPDGFPLPEQFNITMNGSTIANDYRILRNLLNTYDSYKSSIIIGPSISYAGEKSLGLRIAQEFLNASGGNYINALTFHFYYFMAKNAHLNDFFNHTVMDSILKQINPMNQLGFNTVWLGETASAAGGGLVNVSNTFADGFFWLDKLGISALNGLKVVIRQQLHGSNYPLLNDTLYPNHDYWLSLVYKKLIGIQIFNTSIDIQDVNLRLYASSSKNLDNGIVIYGTRLINESISLDFPQFSTRQAILYVFKEGETSVLNSRTSKLNNQLLEWIPHMPGATYNGAVTSMPVEIPPYSQFFIVIDQNNKNICPSGWYKESTNSGKCIQFFNTTQPLFGAKFDCGLYGANSSILSISNAFENAEILKQTQTQMCSQFFIGLERNGSSWNWSNGLSNSFQNWKNGYPTMDSTKNCATFDANTGTWVNEDCDVLLCYMCQKYF